MLKLSPNLYLGLCLPTPPLSGFPTAQESPPRGFQPANKELIHHNFPLFFFGTFQIILTYKIALPYLHLLIFSSISLASNIPGNLYLKMI